MAVLLGLIVLTAFFTSSSVACKDDTCVSQISMKVLTTDLTEGIYYSSESESTWIHFISRRDSLSVFAAGEKSIIQVSSSVGNYRLISIADAYFVQKVVETDTGKLVKDYFIPDHVKALYSINQVHDSLFFEHLINTLDNTLSHVHQLFLQDSVSTLTSSVESKLIVNAVLAMGRDMAITGRDYPSVLPLYMTAMQLDKLLTNVTSFSKRNGSFIQVDVDTFADYDCLDDCPPCEEELCLGMCGYSCSCWKWVCGDCCYHLGCYGHDVCCREKFVQTKCLFPVGFKCESEYSC